MIPGAVVRGSAPGRVNLIGDHTDYNGGFVLPICLPLRTSVTLRRRADRSVHASTSSMKDGSGSFDLDDLRPTGKWFDYPQGVIHELRGRGIELGGFDLHVASTVPVGSGLSSSAALAVALLRALREAFDLSLTDVELARVAQRAETEFVGAKVGIMDQMACSVGSTEGALYLNTRSLEYELVKLPAGAELIVLDSRVTHAHATGEYSVRRAECELAAGQLGVPYLTDLEWPADAASIDRLGAPLGQRVRHVVTENSRVHAVVTAFRRGDLEEVGRLFFESHRSLRDDYAVSVPELDALVDAARSDPDVFGARLTGGGFGGCVVALARAGASGDAGTRMIRRAARTGFPSPRVLLPEAP